MASKNKFNAYDTVENNYKQILLSELSVSKLLIDADSNNPANILTIGDINISNLDIENKKLQIRKHRLGDEFSYDNQSFDGVILKSYLYRTSSPIDLIAEILRILKPSGRLVILDPAISLVSWLSYSFAKDSHINMNINPFKVSNNDRNNNIAYLTMLFTKQEYRIIFMEKFPEFNMKKRKWLGMFADPISYIMRSNGFLPICSIRVILKLEEILNPFLARWLSHKMLITLEKNNKVK